MSVTNFNKTDIEKMSMVDLANLLFAEEQRPMSFKEAFDKIAELKNWDETEKDNKIAQFYTDLNIDGRFVTNGSNSWGLKRWYRSEQINEDLSLDDLDDMIEDIEEEEERINYMAEEQNDDTIDEEDYDGYVDEDTEIDDEEFDEQFEEEYEDDYDV
ncbi:MAG TPA: DNA-directed RNA polymerase subunit delta [Bacillota bacterium]|nr:DNA-directed RNA polymerase subunit delta [Bacillota bacterium]